MKKMKRIVTLLMTVVMMMAMSVTAFAAEAKTTITINNLGAGATLTYAQVIEADTTTETGLNIVDNYVAAFSEVLGNDKSEQELIKLYEGANESVKANVLKKIATSTKTSNPIEVSSVGLYVITPVAGDGEAYTYNKMGVFVDTADLHTNITVNAKKEPTKLDKVLVNADDAYVAIGDDVEYKVSSTLPYVYDDEQENIVRFAINDTLTGAKYKLNPEGKFEVSVKIGTANPVVFTEDDEELTVTRTDANESFKLDLSQYVDATNTNANVAVEVTYTAVAYELIVGNDVYPTVNGHDYNSEENRKKITSYSGELTVVKVDKDDNTKKLAGAEFIVEKMDEETTSYAVLDNGKFVSWTDKKEKATHVTTDANGKVKVSGFDKNVTYYFEEVVAPTGYSLNSTPEPATWKADVAEATVQQAEATVKDTTLIKLPFTGGMGTTIFTVLGVAIMAIAAALFFATKKSKN